MAALTERSFPVAFPVAHPQHSQLDVLKAQVEAIDAWVRADRSATDAAAGASLTREMRLDLSRRQEARRREKAALLARVDAQLRASAETFLAGTAVRAVLAHRSEWAGQKIAERLQQHGVHVVGVFQDGAEAAGTVVAEQPELVLVEDRLPTLPGSELVRRVRQFSPLSVVGAQVLDGTGVPEIVDAGAHAVFTRRIPPAEIADQLVGCLAGSGRTLTLT